MSVGCAPRNCSLSLFALDNGTAASLQITSRTFTPSKWSVAQPNIMIGIWAIVALSFTASPCHAAVHSAAFVSSIGSQLSHQRSITGCASSGHRREISSEGYRATNLHVSKDDDTFLIDADVAPGNHDGTIFRWGERKSRTVPSACCGGCAGG